MGFSWTFLGTNKRLFFVLKLFMNEIYIPLFKCKSITLSNIYYLHIPFKLLIYNPIRLNCLYTYTIIRIFLLSIF